MSVPTVNVTCTVNDSEGNPVEGARVSAKLSTAEKYNGFVVPLTTNAVSDSTGVAVLALFPNQLGSEGSEYAFKIMNPSTGKSIKFSAVIPNLDCNLFEIANVPPYPREYVGETFSKPVFEARDKTLESMVDAESSKTAAAQSEANALASENNASSFAADAQQSKSEALGSSISASTSAGQAQTAKIAAESARDGAVVAKGGAEAARDGAVSAKNSVDASVASIPGLIDTEKVAAVGAVQSQETTSVAAVQAVYQNDLDLLKSKQAREIGGTAYQTILGFPCPPSLEVKAWDAKDNTNGVPDGFTFARASSATQVNAVGQIETVANDVLRHDYGPETGEYKGFLIEEQRTNLLTYSEQFDNAAWSKVDASILTDAVVAPDGSSSGVKLVENTNTSVHYCRQDATAVSGNYYTSSLFAKAGERDHLIIIMSSSGFGTNVKAVFDLVNVTATVEVAGTNTSANIKSDGNGWFRCWVTSQATASAGFIHRYDLNNGETNTYKGDGVSGIYLWGAQFEQGSFPTSYIPTTTAAATRGDYTLSIATADFPYNQNEGTIFVEFIADVPPNGRIVSFSLGGDLIELRTWGDGGLRGSIYKSGAYEVNLSAGLQTSETVKISFGFSQNDVALVRDGQLKAEDLSASIPVMSSLTVGSRNTGYQYINSNIRRVLYFPRRLSNEQLQALTR
ncbi:phage head spike fiber domain-containing protein [Maridesulfovibrio bastinii]|uniref:phage head spike fiber domain-containing protein n=1 Tax=Maridesulfovibrio bastinii TaxID=47157 RepID=UPI000415C6FF|nr:hypothetical protein [Maridesulfovibrio bastinii]